MTFTHADDWDPLFAQRSPMFEAFARPCAQWRDGPGFPDRQRCAAALDAVPVRNSSGRALQLAEPADAAGAWGYERSIAESAELGFRQGNWHDLMNLLVWCVFPQSKARLNAAHLADPAGCARPAARWAAPPRSALRDALTLFDENGVIVASADPSLDRLLREFRWRELFVDRRAQVLESMRFIVFGHGLLDKARAPFIGLTGHACVLPLAPALRRLDADALAGALDPAVAAWIAGLRDPGELAPLPVLGVPGWWPGNEQSQFYDDTRYFRTGRRPRGTQ